MRAAGYEAAGDLSDRHGLGSFHKMCVDNKIRKEEMQRRNEDNYEKEKIIGNRNECNVYSSINDRLWQQQRSKRL